MRNEEIKRFYDQDNHLLGVLFRNKYYLLKDNTYEAGSKLFKDIIAEHPDFYEVFHKEGNHVENVVTTKIEFNKVVEKHNEEIKKAENIATAKEIRAKVDSIIDEEEAKRAKQQKEQNNNHSEKKEVQETEEVITEKAIYKGWTRALFGGVALLALVLAVKGCQNSKPLTESESVITDTSSNQDADVSNAMYTEEQLAAMNFDELCALLNEGQQNETFRLLEDTQNYMNEKTLPSIKKDTDEGSQLYIKANEIIGAFITVNADTYANDTFVKLFGNSGALDATKISEGFLQTCEIMNTYYSRATQRSGISNLFIDAEDQKIVNQAEDLVIAYNKSKTEEEKAKAAADIISMLKQMGNIDTEAEIMDPAYKEQKGATAYVYTTLIPWLAMNREIDSTEYSEYGFDELYEQLININEGVVCNSLHQETKQIEALANATYATEKELDENSKIVKFIIPAMDKNNPQVKDRNVVFGNSNKYKEDFNDKYATSNGGYTMVQSNQTQTGGQVSRAEAVAVAGESAVEKAEQEAGQKVEETNTSERANGYQAGYNAAYEAAYNQAAANGTKASISSTGGSGSYALGYSQGVSAGLASGYTDGMIEYNAKQNANTNQSTSQTEKPLGSQTPNTSEGEETYIGGTSASQSISQTEKPVESQVPNTSEGEEVYIPGQEASGTSTHTLLQTATLLGTQVSNNDGNETAFFQEEKSYTRVRS